MANREQEEIRIEGVKLEAAQNKAAVDDNAIQVDKVEAERNKALAERDAARIIAEARTNAQRRMEATIAEARINAMRQMKATINEAEEKAKDREQEINSGKFGDIQSQILPEDKNIIVEHTDSSTVEAEQTASRILDEAKERARYSTAIEYEDDTDSRDNKKPPIELEPNAPNLLAELRKRYAVIEFGEFQVSQYASRHAENVDSPTIEFAVLSGDKKEQIGRYLVHTTSLEIVGKMYEHWGKFLVIRGRVSDWDYQYLQQLVGKGQLHDANRNGVRDGMRNFVIYNLPVFVWSAAYGREDRYINDVQFP